MKVKLDRYERSLERADFRPANKRERERIEQLLDKIRKNRNVNIRLSEETVTALKKRSLREGIPYQTLISSILHKFVTNQYLEEAEVRRSMRSISSGRRLRRARGTL
jgi:predicted DNA binding CopG/RHH family protein